MPLVYLIGLQTILRGEFNKLKTAEDTKTELEDWNSKLKQFKRKGGN
jgi:hypothetical protein